MKLFNLMSAFLLLTSAPAVMTAANANPPARGNVIQSVADLQNPFEMEVCQPLSLGGKTIPHLRHFSENAASSEFSNPARRRTPAIPMATDDDVTTMAKVIKGSLYWDNAWGGGRQKWGMYSLPATGGDFTLLTSEDSFTKLDYVAMGGGTPFGNDSYYLTAFSVNDDGSIKQILGTVFNSETWEPLRYQFFTVEKDGVKYPDVTKVASAMTYDRTTGEIYGSFLREDGESYAFCILDPNEYKLTTIAYLDKEVYWAACGFDAQGQLYALEPDGDFYKVDKTTGKQTLVANTGVKMEYACSGAINPDDNKFYAISTYKVNESAQNSKLYRIDLATGAAEEVYDFTRGIQLFGMYFSSPARSTLAPAAVTDLVCDFNGGLKATAKFTAPKENMGGEELTGLLKVKLSVNYKEVYEGRCRPGAEVSVPVSVEEEGLQRIEVVISNTYGDSRAATLSVYSGVVPGRAIAPSNFTATRDENDLGTLHLTWDHPEKDEYGNPVKTDNFAYNIFTRNLQRLAYNYRGSSLVYRMNDYRDVANDFSKKQLFEKVTIWTGTDLGDGYDYGFDRMFYTDHPLISVGRPYDIPWQDRVTYDGPDYNWIMTSDPEYGDFRWADEWTTSSYTIYPYDNDGGMLVFDPYYKNTGWVMAEVRSGDINLGNAADPSLSFQLYRNKNANQNDVVGVFVFEQDSKEPVVNKTFNVRIDASTEPDAQDGWHLCELPLQALKGKVIYFTFLVGAANVNSAIAFDNIEVRNCSNYDLSVNQLSAPELLVPGRATTFSATVRNWGASPVEGCVVNLLRDGEIEASKTMNLAGGEVSNVLFEVVPSSLLPDQVNYSVEVLFAQDPETDNNRTAPVTLEVIRYTHPAPEALDGKIDAEDLLLSWDEPVFIPVEKVTEDFESYTPYIIDNIGDWVTIDYDNNQVFTVGDGNYENAGVPQAWTVFTHSSYPAFSGNNVLAAFAGEFGKVSTESKYTDNCLISPKLSGNMQYVTFQSRCLDPLRNSDVIEVYYSNKTGDDNDFTDDTFLKLIDNIPSKWTRQTLYVPEGALYLMFRHSGPASSESYGVMIDDIVYEKYGNDNLTMLGYNIYYNGERLNDEPLEDTEFQVKGGKQKEGTYVVTTVYKEGESVPCEGFVYSLSGVDEISGVAGIIVRGAKGAITVNGAQGDVFVYDINGRAVASAAGSDLRFNVEKGVYLVSCGTKTFKVLVD